MTSLKGIPLEWRSDVFQVDSEIGVAIVRDILHNASTHAYCRICEKEVGKASFKKHWMNHFAEDSILITEQEIRSLIVVRS